MWVRSLGQEDPLEKGKAPVFLSGESQGQRSLAGYSPQGCKESGMSLSWSTPYHCLGVIHSQVMFTL